jgi:hypothetical protein
MARTQDPTTSHPWRTRFAALAAGIIAGGAIAWAVWHGHTPVNAVEPSNKAQEQALLAAVERSERATFTVEGTFRRTTDDGRTIEDPEVIVQRPPDRVALGFGAWSGVVGGRVVQCVRDGRHGAFRSCTTPPKPSPIPAEEVRLRQLLEGDQPFYRASDLGSGCYQLRLIRAVEVEPEYGQRAVLCFDPTLHAPTQRRIEHAHATDDTRYDHVSARVDPADLQVP